MHEKCSSKPTYYTYIYAVCVHAYCTQSTRARITEAQRIDAENVIKYVPFDFVTSVLFDKSNVNEPTNELTIDDKIVSDAE